MNLPTPNLVTTRTVIGLDALSRANDSGDLLASTRLDMRNTVANFITDRFITGTHIDLTAFGARAMQLDLCVYVLTPAELAELIAAKARELVSTGHHD